MIVIPAWPRILILGVFALGAASALAQNELRSTFFKDADAAKAAADAVEAEWLAPRTYERGMREYQDAEQALERGRNIEYVRTNAAEAANYFTDAAKGRGQRTGAETGDGPLGGRTGQVRRRDSLPRGR
jgi:hypothetical protein